LCSTWPFGSYGFTTAADGRGCEGTNGYEDVHEGTQVTVSESTGKTIGVGMLGIGRRDDISCTFEFSVPDVPDADFY
jgi:hypothetical protein